jgi:hypothetical protein
MGSCGVQITPPSAEQKKRPMELYRTARRPARDFKASNSGANDHSAEELKRSRRLTCINLGPSILNSLRLEPGGLKCAHIKS